MAMSPEKFAERLVLRNAVDGWGTKPDWKEIWRETCSEDLVLEFCGLPEKVSGLDAVCAFNEELFFGFPSLNQEITGVCATATDVAYRHRLVGKHSGPFMGLNATNRFVDITGMSWMQIKEGKIVHQWYELNHDALKMQLGVA